MNIRKQIDVDSLDSISEELKPYFKELLSYIDNEDPNTYTKDQIHRIINDVNNGTLEILSKNDVVNDDKYDDIFKENPYVLGYYSNDNEKKTIVIRANDNNILGTLSHEFEHYITDNIQPKEIKKYLEEQSKLENQLLLDEENYIDNAELNNNSKTNQRGAFAGDYTNSYWMEMWNEAATEIIALDRVGLNPDGYPRRVNFMNSLLKLNNVSIDDLKTAYRKGDLDFVYHIMPKNFLINISRLESQLYHQADNNNLMGMKNTTYARTVMSSELNNFLADVMITDKFSQLPEAEKIDIVDGILAIQYTGGKDIIDKKEPYIKLEQKMRAIANRAMKKCKNSEEVIDRVEQYSKKHGVYDSINNNGTSAQLSFIKIIGMVKASFGEDTSEIDKICEQYDNTLTHKEKIVMNNYHINQQIGDEKKYIIIENFDKQERHFVYRNGQRYLNSPFDANEMNISIYSFDKSNMRVNIHKEDGHSKKNDDIEYDNEKDFLDDCMVNIKKSIDNRTQISEVLNNGQNQCAELYKQVLSLVKSKQLPQEEKNKSFISSLQSMVNHDNISQLTNESKIKERGIDYNAR